jgi:hypothetical protein
MPKTLPEFAKVSFREEFSFEICNSNSYDASSKQNGVFNIYKTYLKSLMLSSDL